MKFGIKTFTALALVSAFGVKNVMAKTFIGFGAGYGKLEFEDTSEDGGKVDKKTGILAMEAGYVFDVNSYYSASISGFANYNLSGYKYEGMFSSFKLDQKLSLGLNTRAILTTEVVNLYAGLGVSAAWLKSKLRSTYTYYNMFSTTTITKTETENKILPVLRLSLGAEKELIKDVAFFVEGYYNKSLTKVNDGHYLKDSKVGGYGALVGARYYF